MSTCTFSVLVGHASQTTELTAYQRRLNRVEQGVSDLLTPIRRNSEVRLFRRVDADENEWLDIHLHEGPQGSLIPELEKSLGGSLTDIDIERAHARDRVQQALVLLTQLQIKRQWSASDFLRVLQRENLSRAGRQMGGDNSKLTIQSHDGQRHFASLPNRRFSALRSDSVDLQFLPLKVGMDGAQVRLSKASHIIVSGRTRQIEMRWQMDRNSPIPDVLFNAAKTHHWVWAKCRVIENRDGMGKTLLVESIFEHP